MTKTNLKLSRRKTLAALGAIGAASAGAGLGTSAYFNDQETFENNSLTAGSLDLKVDWEEHYNYPQIYGFDDPAEGLDVTREEPDSPGDYTAFPPGAPSGQQSLWVLNEDVEDYMLNTTLEAFPDSDGDRVQDDFADEDVCSSDLFADVPDDLDPTISDRTQNADTYDDDNGEPLPLVNLDDVKPGDFGEVTFSFHLCDNDGYVWMNADNVSSAENDTTEPEGESDAEGSGVELLDEIQTALWYDKGCDNLVSAGGESGTSKADIAFILDRSGSMSDERNSLESEISNVSSSISSSGIDAEFALVPYEQGDDACPTLIATDLTSDPTALDFGYETCGGTENASEAITLALDQLSWRPDAQKILVVLTDEDDDGTSTERSNAITKIDDEDACLLAVSPGGSGSNDLQQIANSVNCGSWTQISDGLAQTEIEDLIDFVSEVTGDEEIFFQGPLSTALGALTSGHGIPLDGQPGDFDEIGGSDDDENRDCFPGGSTQCIGFSWWVPTSVGNEIQTDSVSFDLGFYTEQCRHNDGTAMNDAQVS